MDVVQLGEERIGQRREERDHPNQRDDLKEILKVKFPTPNTLTALEKPAMAYW